MYNAQHAVSTVDDETKKMIFDRFDQYNYVRASCQGKKFVSKRTGKAVDIRITFEKTDVKESDLIKFGHVFEV